MFNRWTNTFVHKNISGNLGEISAIRPINYKEVTTCTMYVLQCTSYPARWCILFSRNSEQLSCARPTISPARVPCNIELVLNEPHTLCLFTRVCKGRATYYYCHEHESLFTSEFLKFLKQYLCNNYGRFLTYMCVHYSEHWGVWINENIS